MLLRSASSEAKKAGADDARKRLHHGGSGLQAAGGAAEILDKQAGDKLAGTRGPPKKRRDRRGAAAAAAATAAASAAATAAATAATAAATAPATAPAPHLLALPPLILENILDGKLALRAAPACRTLARLAREHSDFKVPVISQLPHETNGLSALPHELLEKIVQGRARHCAARACRMLAHVERARIANGRARAERDANAAQRRAAEKRVRAGVPADVVHAVKREWASVG